MNCPPVLALGNVIGFSHFLQFSEAQEQVERQHTVLHGPDTVFVLRCGGLSGECVRGDLHIQMLNWHIEMDLIAPIALARQNLL